MTTVKSSKQKGKTYAFKLRQVSRIASLTAGKLLLLAIGREVKHFTLTGLLLG